MSDYYWTSQWCPECGALMDLVVHVQKCDECGAASPAYQALSDRTKRKLETNHKYGQMAY